MPANMNSQESFSSPDPLMQSRIAFVVGWCFAFFSQRDLPPLQQLVTETGLLRLEVREAREVVGVLQAGQESCEWQSWVQKWIIRANLIFDIFVVFWLVWSRSGGRNVQPSPLPVADTGSTSSDTDEPDISTTRVQRALTGLTVVGKGPQGRGRPTRPSDLKGGK